MPTVRRYLIDLTAEQLEFLEELTSAHGWRVAEEADTIDDTYLALRNARPSLTIISPDWE